MWHIQSYTYTYTYACTYTYASFQPAWDSVFKDLVLKKIVCWATYGNIRPASLFLSTCSSPEYQCGEGPFCVFCFALVSLLDPRCVSSCNVSTVFPPPARIIDPSQFISIRLGSSWFVSIRLGDRRTEMFASIHLDSSRFGSVTNVRKCFRTYTNVTSRPAYVLRRNS